eukprot:TRINITY_DN2958_c0_g1_i3.p1 TRINITY_DN2958_c0_g1~~TRINITY_DN2958_c0_g1_i3.p1  ORF type:complete len:1868 (+),score=383.92 TRINITY_DN2958_c0_g1_i3:38-5605(+)
MASDEAAAAAELEDFDFVDEEMIDQESEKKKRSKDENDSDDDNTTKRPKEDSDDDGDDDDGDVLDRRKRRDPTSESEATDPDFTFTLINKPYQEDDPASVNDAFMSMFFQTPLPKKVQKNIIKEAKVFHDKQAVKKSTKRILVEEDSSDEEGGGDADEAIEAQRALEILKLEANRQRERDQEREQQEQQDEVKSEAAPSDDEVSLHRRLARKQASKKESHEDARRFFGAEGIQSSDQQFISSQVQPLTQIKAKTQLSAVIPPEDMKRLYLRPEDNTIIKADIPERMQLRLEAVGWSLDDLHERLFGEGSGSVLSQMANFIHSESFSTTKFSPKMIITALTCIFKYGNEPSFVQRYCLLGSEEPWTFDDLWLVWEGAFHFMSLYNRRDALKLTLLPVQECFEECLFPGVLTAGSRYPSPNLGVLNRMSERTSEGLESLAYEMFLVSFAELTTRTSQNSYTWEPHYLTWMEQWITHWSDVFEDACRSQQTQNQYRSSTVSIVDAAYGTSITTTKTKARIRSIPVQLRSKGLFKYALRVLPHPSKLAFYLTASQDAELVRVLTYTERTYENGEREEIPLENQQDRERVDAIRSRAKLLPRVALGTQFDQWCQDNMLKELQMNGSALRLALTDMMGGALAAEPRFKQTLLQLIMGKDGDNSVMTLGRLRVQPSTDGFGYFKQGGQSRIGYRNLCLNSRKFTVELKEELLRYINNNLMVWWIELDDPATVKLALEDEFAKGEAFTESQSISQGSTLQSQRLGGQHEVNRMNIKREQMAERSKFTESCVWYPAEQTFQQFKHNMKADKVEVLLSVLRDAHRGGAMIPTTRLPFIPLNDWFLPDQDHPEMQEWVDFRIDIIKNAIWNSIDEIENTIWDKITKSVHAKILSDAEMGLRSMALRAGYSAYRLRMGLQGAGGEHEEAQRLMELEDQIQHVRNDVNDYQLDLTTKVLPGQYRVCGVVYDDVSKTHTMCFLDEYGNYLESFELQHLVMTEEDELVKRKLEEMQIRLRKCLFTHRPQAWALGMTDASDLKVKEMLQKFGVDWQTMMGDDDAKRLLPPTLPKVEFVDSRIARVWARTRAASIEFRDLDESRKRAVCIGRTLRNPLAALASLFTADEDVLSLALSEMQECIPSVKLLRALEQQMVSIVSIIGLDINYLCKQSSRSEQHLLQFLPGLGPRKATNLLRTLSGSAVVLQNRNELRDSPFNFDECVWRNVSGFVKINRKLPVKEGSNMFYELTIDRTRIHPIYYEIVYTLMCSILVGLEELDPSSIEDLSPDDYFDTMKKKTNKLMLNYWSQNESGKASDSKLLRINWDHLKKEWGNSYQDIGDIVGDGLTASMCRNVKIPYLLELIFDELIFPFGIRYSQGDDNDLRTLAEYRPYTQDVVFDTLVSDPTLQKGAIRIATVADQSQTGLRVRISGCPVVRGFIGKGDTVPGSTYSEDEWKIYKHQWFPFGSQIEVVVSSISKDRFQARLNAMPEVLKEAKLKVDKTFKDLDKALRQRDKAKRDGATVAGTETVSQTNETVSQTATQTHLTETNTATSVSVDDHDYDKQPNVINISGHNVRGREPEGGYLMSHPLFRHNIYSSKEAEEQLMLRDQQGRELYGIGDVIIRPNMRNRQNKFWLAVRCPTVLMQNEDDILNLGERAIDDEDRVFEHASFLHIAFELLGGGPACRVIEMSKGLQKEFDFDDVDHLMHSYARSLVHRIQQLREHKNFDPRPYSMVKKWVYRTNKARLTDKMNGGDQHPSLPWKYCNEPPKLDREGNMSVVATRFRAVLPFFSGTRKFRFQLHRDGIKLISAMDDPTIRLHSQLLPDFSAVEKCIVHYYGVCMKAKKATRNLPSMSGSRRGSAHYSGGPRY